MTSSPPPSRLRRWIWIVLSVLVLLAVLAVLFETEDTADVTATEAPPPAPLITVRQVAAAPARAQVQAFAELRPRWDAELRSAVTGRITEVTDAALAGAQVAQGDLLFAIDKTQYEAAVTQAELEVEQARFGILQARNNVAVARKQFERDGQTPPTELAIKLPQLRIAEKTLTAAEGRLRAARRDLADTDVSAPFSGFVTRRQASLGQTVNPGDALLHLSDDSRYELVVELNQDDWALLAHPITGQVAQLHHQDGRPLGQARIARSGGFLDRETRQRRVFLEVTDPSADVLAGDFVRVTLPGRDLADTITIPEGALTRAGHIWLVDADNLLERLTPQILFRADHQVTIAAPGPDGPWHVALTPLASFLPGQRVTPQRAED